MAFTGIHVTCGYASNMSIGTVPMLSDIEWSETLSASGGATTSVVPKQDGARGILVASVIASVDIFVAVGAAPDANASPRVFVPAGTVRDITVKPGWKVAAIPA